MTVTRLSGSRLPIFRHCTWAFRDDVEYEPAARKSNAAFGTTVHGAAYAYLVDGVVPEDEEVFLHLKAIAEELARIPDTVIVHCEPAWAWNPKTRKARMLGENIGREYEKHGLEPDEIPGSMDIVLIREGRLVNVDLKTGYADVEAAEDNDQLSFGSVCYSEIAQKKSLEQRQEIWYVRPGRVWVDGADVDFFKLSEFERRLSSRWATKHLLPSTPGDHCAWCPAAGGCPSTNGVVSSNTSNSALLAWL